MGQFSLVHWIVALIVLFVALFPVIKILQKAGYSGWWVLIWFVPVANIVFLWVFAFADWPNLQKSTAQA